MKKRTWVWIAAAAGIVCLAVVSCCCLTGLLGSIGGGTSRSPSTAGPGEALPAPSPLPPATTPSTQVADPAPPPTPVAGPCDDLDPLDMPEFERQARIDLDVLVGPDRRPRLRLRQNLPVGTVVMTDVEGRNFHGQSRVIIDSPCVVAGPFGAESTGLPLGVYTAHAMTPDAAVQPLAVRAAFGARGAALRGPQTRSERGERRVQVERRFNIGDVEAARANDAQRAAITRELQRRLRQAIQAGRAMRGLRRDQSLGGLRACGDRMRELQAELRQIRTEAEANGDRQIAAATGSAMMCVSCTSTADRYCQDP